MSERGGSRCDGEGEPVGGPAGGVEREGSGAAEDLAGRGLRRDPGGEAQQGVLGAEEGAGVVVEGLRQI